MIISTNFLCGRSNFKSKCEGFIRFPNARKHQFEITRPQAEWFYFFERSGGNLMKPEARVLKIVLQQKERVEYELTKNTGRENILPK